MEDRHLSPLKWEHINLTGDYHWRRDGGLRNRKLRRCVHFGANRWCRQFQLLGTLNRDATGMWTQMQKATRQVTGGGVRQHVVLHYTHRPTAFYVLLQVAVVRTTYDRFEFSTEFNTFRALAITAEAPWRHWALCWGVISVRQQNAGCTARLAWAELLSKQ